MLIGAFVIVGAVAGCSEPSERVHLTPWAPEDTNRPLVPEPVVPVVDVPPIHEPQWQATGGVPDDPVDMARMLAGLPYEEGQHRHHGVGTADEPHHGPPAEEAHHRAELAAHDRDLYFQVDCDAFCAEQRGGEGANRIENCLGPCFRCSQVSIRAQSLTPDPQLGREKFDACWADIYALGAFAK